LWQYSFNAYYTSSDVFVYGVATSDNAPGEKNIVAAIVPTDSETFSAEKLYRHCRHKLESSHVPDFIQLVSEIPKTASEKPQERFLLEDFQSGTVVIFASTST
jgi:crotonobetaine/carnitine-CoA ligase